MIKKNGNIRILLRMRFISFLFRIKKANEIFVICSFNLLHPNSCYRLQSTFVFHFFFQMFLDLVQSSGRFTGFDPIQHTIHKVGWMASNLYFC